MFAPMNNLSSVFGENFFDIFKTNTKTMYMSCKAEASTLVRDAFSLIWSEKVISFHLYMGPNTYD